MILVGLMVLLAIAGYSLFSKAISKSLLTLPIFFTAVGYALSAPLHEVLAPELIHEGKKGLAEVTLILVLFSDASHVRFRHLARSWQIPARMLAIGMPLTIALGTLCVYLLNPAAGLAVALLTAAVLTPTDAALGQAVVASPDVPERLGQSINVESGLNDGLALPFVLLGATLASAMLEAGGGTGALARDALTQIILGPLAGLAVGWGAAKAMDAAQGRDLMEEPAEAIFFLVSAFAAYALADAIGGNGFIAAFVAGMTFGNSYKHDITFISEFMEGAGQLLTMLSFLIFGAFLLPDGLAHTSAMTALLALLFLTVVRMFPVWLSLAGTGLALREKLFLGWFGPRGLASVLFTLVVLDEFDLAVEDELLACVSLTVGFSILLHGLTSNPLARRIGGKGARDGA